MCKKKHHLPFFIEKRDFLISRSVARRETVSLPARITKSLVRFFLPHALERSRSAQFHGKEFLVKFIYTARWEKNKLFCEIGI